MYLQSKSRGVARGFVDREPAQHGRMPPRLGTGSIEVDDDVLRWERIMGWTRTG